MKQLFSRPSAHGGQRRPRIIWLVTLPLVLSLLLAFSPLASPAFAATHQQMTLHSAAPKVPSSMRLAQIARLAVTPSILTFSRNSTGDPCSTRTIQYDSKDAVGFILFWIKMQTTWCYNYITVTSHATVLSWGVTGTGAALGWVVLGGTNSPPDYSFNCYVAAGAPGNPPSGCSGNHEYMKQYFINQINPLLLETDLTLNEEENYKGQFFWQASMTTCLGGCK